MPHGTSRNSSRLSRRLYVLMLAAYPSEFRRKFGREMAVVFNDRCREEARGGRRALARVWLDAVLDFARTAPAEHLKTIAGGMIMRVLKTVLLALAVYAFTLLVVVPLYMRNREALPGFVNSLVDALIATGIIFNLVYLILTLPRFVEGVRAVRLAGLLTAVVVTGLIALMVFSSGPEARPYPTVYVAQVLSLFVWFAIHLWWVSRRRRETGPPAHA